MEGRYEFAQGTKHLVSKSILKTEIVPSARSKIGAAKRIAQFENVFSTA